MCTNKLPIIQSIELIKTLQWVACSIVYLCSPLSTGVLSDLNLYQCLVILKYVDKSIIIRKTGLSLLSLSLLFLCSTLHSSFYDIATILQKMISIIFVERYETTPLVAHHYWLT